MKELRKNGTSIAKLTNADGRTIGWAVRWWNSELSVLWLGDDRAAVTAIIKRCDAPKFANQALIRLFSLCDLNLTIIVSMVLNIAIIGTLLATSLNATRAADTLILLGKAGANGMLLKEISTELGVAKPSVLRCLNALTESGFAEQVARGRYRLGPAIFSLARSESAVEIEVDHWRPILEEVAETFGQTVYLVRRAGRNVVVADKQVGSAPVQALISDIGGRLPLGIGSGSVAILASMDQPDWEAIVDHNSEKYVGFGVEKDAISKLVRRSNIQGFVCDKEVFIPDCGGIGVPIRDPGKYEANLAISLSSPASFIDRIIPSEVAGQISELIRQHSKRC